MDTSNNHYLPSYLRLLPIASSVAPLSSVHTARVKRGSFLTAHVTYGHLRFCRLLNISANLFPITPSIRTTSSQPPFPIHLFPLPLSSCVSVWYIMARLPALMVFLALLFPILGHALKFDLVAQPGHSAKNERCIRNFVNRDTLVVVTATVSGNRGDGQMVNMHVC